MILPVLRHPVGQTLLSGHDHAAGRPDKSVRPTTLPLLFVLLSVAGMVMMSRDGVAGYERR